MACGVSLFFSDNRKQDTETTPKYSERVIELLQTRTVFFADMITIWKNMDSCADQ